jgi:hypothetical protein
MSVAPTIFLTPINEKSTAVYRVALKDENEQAIGSGSIDSLTLTFSDVGNGAIINSRQGQNILNANNVEVTIAPTLADGVGALVGAHGQAARTVSLDGIDATGALVPGDTLVIAGHSQRYTIQAPATAVAGAVTVDIEPGLAVPYADGAVVTLNTGGILTWTMQPLDTAIQNVTLEKEVHRATFEMQFNGVGYATWDVDFVVRNLSQVT